MSDGIDVGAVEDFPLQAGRRIYGDQINLPYDIAILNDEGTLYAIDDTCTHSAVSLTEGWVENGAVECPLHAACFSLATGEALCLPAVRPVNTHQVEVIDGRVLLYPDLPRR